MDRCVVARSFKLRIMPSDQVIAVRYQVTLRKARFTHVRYYIRKGCGEQ